MGVLFGTNGIRGVAGETITPKFAFRIGKSIGKVYGGTIAVATDARSSADMVRSAVVSGIAAAGIDAVELGMLPTPALQYFVRTHDGISGGAVITASHNPPEFNGIKCVSSDGTEAHRMEESSIEDAYFHEFPNADPGSTGEIYSYSGAAGDYADAVLSRVDRAKIRESGFTVCIDCANGASCYTSPTVLSGLGVRTISINSDPRGNPGRGIEPSEDNLADLMSMVKETGADLGIAHDGDADRCIFITPGGKFVSGDQSMAVIASYVLSSASGKVVTPVNTSSVVTDTVRDAGGEMVYTRVGAPAVARKMIECGAVFGGEENGGLIFPEMQYCRDGAMTMAKMLECISERGSLSDLVRGLPEYHSAKIKVPCPDDKKKALSDFFSARVSDLETDNTDGIKVLFEDGWVLMRPSGTEPAYRIFSESRSETTARSRAEEYAGMAEEFLSKKFSS